MRSATARPGSKPNVDHVTPLADHWDAPRFTIDITPDATDRAANTEWLLTNGLGGFAMGTVLGLNTRRYYGYLIAAARPPLERVMLLNSLAERFEILAPNESVKSSHQLATFTFHADEETTHPNVPPPCRFEKGHEWVSWTYQIEDYSVQRQLRLGWGSQCAVVTYRINGPAERHVRLSLSPLTRLLDYHTLTRRHHESGQADSDYTVEAPRPGAMLITGPQATLRLALHPGTSSVHPDWWYSFHYEKELQRGQDHVEDLFTPGSMSVTFAPGGTRRTAALHAEYVGTQRHAGNAAPTTRQVHVAAVQSRMAKTYPKLARRTDLLVAADDFVVPRWLSDGSRCMTILAGYPWFTDWGRDTLISLPGLLLTTGRFDDALGALRSCADALCHGLVPNRFDDSGRGAHYNTVDASLWFLHAACEYVRATRDVSSFVTHLVEPCMEIVNAYHHGTDFDIKADPEDGLIMAGGPSTQLTWMDAMRDGVVFTPRYGKAVEINALWYHGLRSLDTTLSAIGGSHHEHARLLRHMADRVQSTFEPAFAASAHEGLADCLVPDGHGRWLADESVRPNQLFAVSLEYSPMSRKRQVGVVALCRRDLLTPVGLRTLSPKDPKYRGRFEGPLFDRDTAYHQGTVWPWLMGPYVEAMLRTADFSPESLRLAASMLDRLEDELAGPDARSLGQLHEVYDGDDDPAAGRPRRPDGCIAQAWSVAELIRCRALIEMHQAK